MSTKPHSKNLHGQMDAAIRLRRTTDLQERLRSPVRQCCGRWLLVAEAFDADEEEQGG